MAMTTHTRRIGAFAATAALGYAAYVAVGLGSAFGHLQRALAGDYRIRIEPEPAVAALARRSMGVAMGPTASATEAEDAEEPGPADQDASELRRQALRNLVNEDREFAALAYDSDPAVRGAFGDFFED
jgi:hypothetical protein